MDHRRTITDQIDLLTISFPEVNNGPRVQQAARAAIQSVYRQFPLKHEWAHLRRVAVVTTNEPYDTGTVDIASGIATLTGGTWPAWAANGVLTVGTARYRALERRSDTELSLDANQQPAENVDDSEYQLLCPVYSLPSDFGQVVDVFRGNSGAFKLCYVGERHWPSVDAWPRSPATPQQYTIDGQRGGSMQLTLFPAPSASEELRVYYRAYQRPFAIQQPYQTGTVSVSGRTVTGTGTTFPTDAAGMILRLGDSTNVPTGKFGKTPYAAAYAVVRRASATSLLLAESADTFSGVKFTLDDPVDIDPNSMGRAFDRAVEAEFVELIKSDPKVRALARQLADQELSRAKADDHRPTKANISVMDYFGEVPEVTFR